MQRVHDLVFLPRAWRDSGLTDTPIIVQTWIRRALWAAILGAFVLRAWIVWRSIGSEDARLWEGFARTIGENGLLATYRERGDFNHPPVMALFGWLALKAAQALDTRFSIVFKLPFLAADVLTAVVLWRIWRGKGEFRATLVVALFSWSLISILVSAYHGNTDSLCAALSLASAYALQSRRYGLSGLLLGAAINVKIVPVMLIPVFLSFARSRSHGVRMVQGLAVAALPFAALAIFAWSHLFSNILGYTSSPFQWGVTYFMQKSAATLPHVSMWLAEAYVPSGRYILFGSMVCIGLLQYWRQRLNPFQAGALALCLFMVMIPGFGIQYLVWPLPLLFAAHPAWASKYATVGGVFAFVVYYLFWTGTTPWFSHFRMSFPPPAPLLGLLTWAMLTGYVASGLRPLLFGGARWRR